MRTKICLILLLISLRLYAPEDIYIRQESIFVDHKKQKRSQEIVEFNRFLKEERLSLFILAMRESARPDLGDTVPNYNAYNSYGFVGAWQINIKYMDYLGIPSFTIEEFISNPDSVFPPELQLIAVDRLIEKNKHYLRGYWHYVGRRVRGIDITEDGVIFAAHLAGHVGVKRFFKYGKDPMDANKTKLTDYLNYKKTFYYGQEI